MTPAARAQSSDAELFAVMRRLGLDPMTLVDPGSALICAAGRRECRQCKAKPKCRLALRQSQVTWSTFSLFCPAIDALFELAQRGLPRSA